MPEEEKKEDDKIILQVDMHCEGCKAKVRKALKEFKGVEGLDVSMQEQKVTIKGKLDAKKVYETVKKKSGKRTILLYPDPKKVAEDEKKAKEEPKKEEPPPPDPEVVVVLKVNMHCGACAKQIRRSLLKIDGVTDAKEDFAKGIVTVTGKKLDPNKLCARVKKRSGKHCEIVPPPPPPPPAPPAPADPPKEEEKKEEAKPAEEKKEEEKKEEAKPAEEAKKDEEKPAAAEAAPPAAEGDKKAEEKKEEEKKEAAPEEKKEEKSEEKKEEKKEETPGETKIEVKKYEYIPYRSVPEYYVYPPQLFSDENPNACSIM